MSNLDEVVSPTVERNDRKRSSEDATNHFRRRILGGRRRFSCPRRCVMALMLFILVFIEVLRSIKAYDYFDYEILTRYFEKYTSVDDRDFKEIGLLYTYIAIGCIFADLLGGLLIYRFSSYNFLLVSVGVSSILLATLTRTALSNHSITVLHINMVVQKVLSVPLFPAVLSIWKDWAPPDERSRLVTISFCGFGVYAVNMLFFYLRITRWDEKMNVYVGIAGIIWVLFWYNITTSTPQSDPLITEKEFLYLESKIPSNCQERTSLRDVPWIPMFKCKQVLILFLVFFKTAISFRSIHFNGHLFLEFLEGDPLYIFIPFTIAFISVFLGSSFVMDYLLQKYRERDLIIRKAFMCTGFVLPSVFLLGAIIPSDVFIRSVFYAVAYTIFAVSIPGVLRIPLDLSPRYVPILAGFAFASHTTGELCFDKLNGLIYTASIKLLDSPILIFDCVFSVVTGVVFWMWGDVHEQPWSYLDSSRRGRSDYRSHPQLGVETESNLV